MLRKSKENGRHFETAFSSGTNTLPSLGGRCPRKRADEDYNSWEISKLTLYNEKTGKSLPSPRGEGKSKRSLRIRKPILYLLSFLRILRGMDRPIFCGLIRPSPPLKRRRPPAFKFEATRSGGSILYRREGKQKCSLRMRKPILRAYRFLSHVALTSSGARFISCAKRNHNVPRKRQL